MAARNQTPEVTNANHGEDIHVEAVSSITEFKTQLEKAQTTIDELNEALEDTRIAQGEDKASMSQLSAKLKTANEENHSLSQKLESTKQDLVRLRSGSNKTIEGLKSELETLETENRAADRRRRADTRQITSLQEEQCASNTLRTTMQVALSERKDLEQELRAARDGMRNCEAEMRAALETRLQGELRERGKKYDEYPRKTVQQYSKAVKGAEWQCQEEIKERDRRHDEFCRKQDQQHSEAAKEAGRVLNGCIDELEAQKKDLEDRLNVQIDTNHELESRIVLAQEQLFKKVDESSFLGDSDPAIINLFSSLSESIHFLAKAHSISAWPRLGDTNAIDELENALKDLVLPDDIGGHQMFPHDLFRRTKNASALCISAALANMVCVRILEDPFWFFPAREQMMEIYKSLEKVDLFQAQIWRSQLLRLVQKTEKAGMQNPLARLRRPATQQVVQDFLDSAPARHLLRPLIQNTNAYVLNREVQHIFEAASDLSLRLGCNRAKVELFLDVFAASREFMFRFGSKYVQGHLYHKLNKDTYGDDERLTRFDGRTAKILIFPIVLASGDEDGQGYNKNHRIWSKGIYWMNE